MTYTPFFDGQKGPEIRDKLNELYVLWEDAIGSATGPRGWSPLLAVVSDGARKVLQIVDWAGGEGEKPTVTGYLGASGLVPTAAQAMDISGGVGPSNVLSIGTVTEGEAAATITGTSPAQVLDLVLPRGMQGFEGWSPVYGAVVDGARVVLQVVDWTGGTGTEPASGMYLGPVGFVPLIADATNIRGPGGSGSGDVTGPSTVVDGNIAIFDDATGKVIADGGPVPNWTNLGLMPDFVAAGNTQEAARAVIGAIGEAPIDGKQYARKDAAWVEVTGGGGVDVVATPTNISPASAATGIGETPELTGSAYGNAYGFPKASGRWQVSTVSNFSTTVVDSGDVAGTGVTYTVPGSLLVVSTVYYWRVMYKDNQGNSSQWSVPTSFTTDSAFNSYIPTPAPTPAVGTAFEGGFYSGGMIWNEIAQSATSTVIGTGSKVFTVPDMTGAPIVYFGQTVEVRSRANPANKMAGTVTGAAGTNLTITVTSVGGAGTFADWSVMSRFRVIVAPKSSGDNASIAYKNTNTAAPAATATLTEGRRATLAMIEDDTSTVYPAAHWCNSLNIGGKTDWYLPARDELELCWRNLKPTTDTNYTAAERPVSTYNYTNLGSYGDTAATQGSNNNSAPAGAAYTSGSPDQTAVTAFRTGGAEAFEYGSAILYWSSTEYNSSDAWRQYWNSARAGGQIVNNKTVLSRVRAVRRSII